MPSEFLFHPVLSRLLDLRISGAAFLVLTLLALGVATWLGYHADSSEQLFSDSSFVMQGSAQR